MIFTHYKVFVAEHLVIVLSKSERLVLPGGSFLGRSYGSEILYHVLFHVQSNFNGSSTFGTIKYVRDRGSSSY